MAVSIPYGTIESCNFPNAVYTPCICFNSLRCDWETNSKASDDAILHVSIPYGAIESVHNIYGKDFTGEFQFLTVRLRGLFAVE